jgi:glutathione S-transferase
MQNSTALSDVLAAFEDGKENEHFERAYHVQMNTLGQMVFFLPSMWPYSLLLTDKGAAVGGLIWVIGLRSQSSIPWNWIYDFLYCWGLFLGAAYGVVKALL